MEKAARKKFEEIVRRVLEYNPGADVDFLKRTFEYALDAHKGQFRRSGDPFISHCLSVAEISVDLQLDYISIASAFLHDVVEDTDTPISEIEEKFGGEVAKIVNGLTKIAELHLESREVRQAENFRKMLLSMSEDLRVILIKFADRLHNMRTIEHLLPENQIRIANETLEVYAPLAHRFGINTLKSELEDLVLKVLDREAYREIEKKVALKRAEREAYLQEAIEPIEKELKRIGIEARVVGRVKHFYSIYAKMKRRGKTFEEILDLIAVRITVDKIEECYHALGVVHSLYKPLQEKFTDYVAVPKANMYQSLHSKVIGPDGLVLEIQIRTDDMDKRAEVGIAAHWKYKEGKAPSDEIDAHAKWLREVLDWQLESTSSTEFMETLKINLFQDEIFVFTPGGRLIKLSKNSTPIDFAFGVHSDIGLHTIGAKVNGKMVSLSSTLYSGDTVEIITSANQKPSLDWLKNVKTNRARSRLRKYFREAQFDQSVKLGAEIIERELSKLKIRPAKSDLEEIAVSFGHSDLEGLYAVVGAGDVPVQNVIRKLVPKESESKIQSSLFGRIKQIGKKGPKGVRVQGLDNLMINFAQCCRPLPGDKITGFLTTGKGITIHRTDCRNIENWLGDPARNIAVEWDAPPNTNFNARIRVTAEDRKHLLRDITESISSQDVNILALEMKLADAIAQGDFIVEVHHLPHLVKVIRSVRHTKGVISVQRLDQIGEDDLMADLNSTSVKN